MIMMKFSILTYALLFMIHSQVLLLEADGALAQGQAYYPDDETQTTTEKGRIFDNALDDGWLQTRVNDYIHTQMEVLWVVIYILTALMVAEVAMFLYYIMCPRGTSSERVRPGKRPNNQQSSVSSAAPSASPFERDMTARSSIVAPSVREPISSSRTSHVLKKPSIVSLATCLALLALAAYVEAQGVATPEQTAILDARRNRWHKRAMRRIIGIWVCVGFALVLVLVSFISMLYTVCCRSYNSFASNRPGRPRSPSMLSDAFGKNSTALPNRRSVLSGSSLRSKSSSSSARRKAKK